MQHAGDSGKLSRKLIEIQQSRITNGKKYSLYRLSRDSGVDYGHVHRVVNGKSVPSKDILSKLCNALKCNREERTAIFHAAGYLSPDEEEAEESQLIV